MREASKSLEALKKVIKAFHAYYDVNLEDPIHPFVAEATFRLHDEQYFLIRKARVSVVDSNEFVYFADGGELLTAEKYAEYDRIAWEDGLKRADPKPNHKNSDVTVVVAAESIEPECADIIRKAKHHISYKFSFHGWSTYRVVAYDLSKETIIYNRRGRELKKIFGNIKVF